MEEMQVSSHKSKKEHVVVVLTESGQPCHFPFRHNRQLYHSCISKGRKRLWCAITKNYDKDQKWSYCTEEKVVKDHCAKSPCENGGTCQSTFTNYKCECPDGYTGRDCQTEMCFDAQLLQYFHLEESWMRARPPNVEECHCSRKGTSCKRTKVKACDVNPCLNGGHCWEAKKSRVCGCPKEYTGKFCDIDLGEICYSGNGASYRGTAQTTASGLECLPWNSDIMFHELSIHSVDAALGSGLGGHPYCRNPGNDVQPWCYVVKDHRISWEHCNIPKCNMTDEEATPVTKETPPGSKGSAPETRETTPGTSDTVAGTPEPLVKSETSLPSCGKRNKKSPSMTSRIVGGLVALPGSHPYMAALYLGKQFCGGTLIAPCWVVTAAHCLQIISDPSQMTIVLGQNNFNETSKNTATFQVQAYFPHEEYVQSTYVHDIALVRLKEKDGHCAEYSSFIQPACLPSGQDPVSAGTQCEIVGWGHQFEEASEYSDFLQEASVPIIPLDRCRAPDIHGKRIGPGMLCAGFLEGGTDACQGDSGGPLVCELEGQMVLHGVVSWGSGCADENKPGVYTNVAAYSTWIQEVMSRYRASPMGDAPNSAASSHHQ
ncbi:coagulation factor XII [Lissotriton helveticus]